VVGVDEDPQDLMEMLSQMIYDKCSPTLLPRIYVENYDGVVVVVLEVSSGSNKPYRMKGDERGVYIRVGNTTLRATADIIEELRWQTQGKGYDEMPCYGAKVEDLQLGRIVDILRRKRVPDATVIPQGIYRSLKLHLEENGQIYPTNGSVLLFHGEPQLLFSEASTICTVFAGISGRDIVKTHDRFPRFAIVPFPPAV